MDNELARAPIGGEVGLRDLLGEVWAQRWTVFGLTLIFTVVGFAAGMLIPKKYQAEILLAATESPSGGAGGLGAIASQYGALASLAGMSASNKGPKEEAVALLQSRLITEAYVKESNLLPILYADRWDGTASKWKSMDPAEIPTLWMASRYFTKSIRDVKEDKQSGLVTVRITWRDPHAAAKWANDLVRITNVYLRDKAIRQSERNIAYLNTQAAKTDLVEARTAIFSILKDEVNKEMIAKGRDEYALKVLDPAQAPELPTTPSALVLSGAGLGVGLILSGLLVWRRSSLNRQDT